MQSIAIDTVINQSNTQNEETAMDINEILENAEFITFQYVNTVNGRGQIQGGYEDTQFGQRLDPWSNQLVQVTVTTGSGHEVVVTEKEDPNFSECYSAFHNGMDGDHEMLFGGKNASDDMMNILVGVHMEIQTAKSMIENTRVKMQGYDLSIPHGRHWFDNGCKEIAELTKRLEDLKELFENHEYWTREDERRVGAYEFDV